VRGRFAPSPTGRFHLGNARTALLAWLQVRSVGGALVMRVEDLDPQRSSKQHEQSQLSDLRWLGLDWDEGPDVGGSRGPYRQSERSEHYAVAAAKLDTFACSCTRRELREATFAPHGSEPIYPGTCRGRLDHGGRPTALRWRTPPGTISFRDLVVGPRSQDMREIGDFVLRRGDGAWAYQLAVVVDDAAMGIDHVLRGADLVESTPRQIQLQRALGLATPRYAHAPLVVGNDGNKLNKRHGVPDLGHLRADGIEAGVVVAALARSLGLVPQSVGKIAAAELVQMWDESTLRTLGRGHIVSPSF